MSRFTPSAIALALFAITAAACGSESNADDPTAPAAATPPGDSPAADTPPAGEPAGGPTQPSSGTTGPGSWARIAKHDEYKGLIGATIHDGRLFHAVEDGTLYATNLTTGELETVSRKPDFGGVRWLMHGGDTMLSIDRDGTVYRIGADATRTAVGERRAYADTIAATAADGHLFTIEKDGSLYDTDLTTAKWKTIGKAEYGGTRRMYAGDGHLFTVESDGSAFHITPTSGAWYNVGPNEAWKNTVAATFAGGALYRIAAGGVLYRVDITDKGTMTPMGEADFAHVRWLGYDGTSLITMEKDGSLYRVATQ